MAKFISFLVCFFLLILLTIINYTNTTDLSLIFYTFENIPGVLLLYTGILLGMIITIPLMLSYSKRYAKEVLNKSITDETKRLKQEEKKQKKQQQKSNTQKKPPIITGHVFL